jgi:hypothetical protein
MSSDDKKEQSNRVRQNIPSGYFLHREQSTERSYHKSCLECDTEIKNGDYYVFDGIAIQFCLECAETREWSDESDDDDDEEEKIRVANLRRLLPSKYEVREVTGSHRKPCSDCGKQSWSCGDYYVFDSSNPYGTAKFCIECAEHRDWGNEREGEEEIIRSNIEIVSNPTFSISCHTGFPNDHPTAGRHHIGGLSSAMIGRGAKMTRECIRDNGFGRKCRGDIISYTEEGFQLATCSNCCLPAEEYNPNRQRANESSSKRGADTNESEDSRREKKHKTNGGECER